MMWPARCAMGLVAVVAGPMLHTVFWPKDPPRSASMDPAGSIVTLTPAKARPGEALAASGPPVRVVLDSPFGPVTAGPSALRKPEPRQEPERVAAPAKPAAPARVEAAGLDQPQDIDAAVSGKPKARRAARREASREPVMPDESMGDSGWIEYEAPPPAEERRSRSKRWRDADAGWRPVYERRQQQLPLPAPFVSLLR